MKNIMRVSVVVFVLLVGGGGVWSFLSPNKVPVITPVRGPVVQAVYATGTVEPTSMIPIAPRISARLTNILMDEGDDVAAGDVLATLEDTDVQNQVVQAQAQLALAQTNYDRIAPLAAKGAVTRRSLDEADAALKSATADLERLRAQAGYMQLVAPAPGRIIRRDGEVGEFVTAGTPVFYMAADTSLRITSEVDEEDIPLVKPGQDVLIQSDPFGDQIFHGQVTAITPKGDATSRSYRVRIGFKDAQIPLMIGMTAETNIMTGRDDHALLIPLTAINDNNVQVVRGGIVTKTPVTIGIRTTRVAAVTSGMGEKDIILETFTPDLTGKQISPDQKKFDVTAPAGTGKR